MKSWSYSALSSYKQCPHKYYRVSVKKDIPFVETEAIKQGKKIHEAIEQYLTRQLQLPEDMQQYLPLVDEIRNLPGTMYVEHQMALNRRLEPTEWFAPDAWSRAAADVLKVDGSTAVVVDWKTGKPRYDGLQASILALHVAQWYPDVELVDTRFVFLNHGVVEEETFSLRGAARARLFDDVLGQVHELYRAWQADAWPKTRSPLCRWCPVSDCEFNPGETTEGRQAHEQG